jgi:hypothetical protein
LKIPLHKALPISTTFLGLPPHSKGIVFLQNVCS